MMMMEMSHRNQTHAPEHRTTARNATVPQISRPPYSGMEARNRSSVASSGSGGRRSVDSNDEYLPRAPAQRRLSGLPRPTKSQSGSRLDAIASSRPAPALPYSTAIKTSNASRSHTTDQDRDILLFYPLDDGAQDNLLPEPLDYTKPSGRRVATSSLDSDPQAILGQVLPDRSKMPRPTVVPPSRYAQRRPEELPPRLIPELQALAAAAAATPVSAPPSSIGSISSPSTLLTDSPGVWSSRNTTPTSMSSYSPAIVPPLKAVSAGKRANTVPIPAVSKMKYPRLPVLQEALHSSGSSVTGKEVPPLDTRSGSKKKKKTPLDSPAPTPPPRSSSVKHKASKSGGDIPSDQQDLVPVRTRPVADLENSPLTKRASRQIERIGESLQDPTQLSTTDPRRRQAPPRPSREGVWSLGPRRPTAVENNLPASSRDQDRAYKAAAAERPAEQPSRSRGSTTRGHGASSSLTSSGLRRPLLQDPGLSQSEAPPAKSRLRSTPKTPNFHSNPVSKVEESASSTRLGKFSSRFAIFGRRPKPSVEVEESSRKLQRKGPVAGTGHEGYGKFARRGRKTSSESEQSGSSSERSESSLERFQNRFRNRKHSISSRRDRNSQSDLDEFATKRLQPVVMRGGSARGDSDSEMLPPNGESELPTSTSSQDVTPWARIDNIGDFIHVPVNYAGSISSRDSNSAPPRTEESNVTFDRYRTPTPAAESERLAGPVYPTSVNTSQSSVFGTVVSTSSADPGMYRVDAKMLKNHDKKGKRSKWNFFSRSTTPIKPAKAQSEAQVGPQKMPVRVSAGPVPRSVPYYAVMESESDNNTTENLGQVLSDAVNSPPPLPRKDASRHPADRKQSPRQSVLLPSLPFAIDTQHVRPLSSPKVPLQREQEYQSPPEVAQPVQPRARRLAAVGRIPRVISRKGRQNPPDLPPISRSEVTPTVVIPPAAQQFRPEMSERPKLGIRTDPLPTRRLDYLERGPLPNTSTAATFRGQPQIQAKKKEFLRFPSKHSSDVSASSSSTGVFSLTAHSSILPTQYHHNPRHQSGEDEVWNEFDDFIDHVMSPAESRSVQPAFRVDGRNANKSSPSRPPARSRPPALAKQATLPEVQSSLAVRTPPVVFPPPLLLSEKSSSSGEIHLRRSRIVSALHSSLDTSSPFSIGEFLAEYGNWNRNSNKLSDRVSTSTAHKSGYVSPITSEPPVETPQRMEHSQQHNAILIDVVGRSKNPAAQSELHFSSLMISRWLSFGRVLFSPAHDEIHNTPERHVLVLDGLGSVDWSVYCAVIYQEQKAYVHDLKEKDAGQSPIEAGHAPTNYRRAEVSSLADPFPFPQSFFSAIVLRFPPMMADHKLRNIIAECRRVLRPGGFLELMLLDLDIVNMGPLTRRAIRELKIRITTSDRSINLKPLSDNMQSHLGQHGFLNLSRCVVGVPVAGKAPVSGDSSSSSRSSQGSYGQQRMSGEGQRSMGQPGRPSSHSRHGHNFSLNDLVSDHSENADEKIGKMVSRTARSWWQHCFEAAVISDGNLSRSVFAERAILRECKMRGSSFKLLIAYTQKPLLENKRRTMSEPIVPTLATAGTSRSKRNVR